MASAKDVTVVIPISPDHWEVAMRAQDSAWSSGAADVRYIIDAGCYGVCYARNEAILGAQTKLILPIDADDYLLPGAIERYAAAWSPGKVVYGGWEEREPIPTDATIGSTPLDWKMAREAPPPGMLSRKHICHATYLFAKEDWQRVGGYDPDFNIGAEDWAFMIALVEAGCELVRLDGDPLYVKTIGENERTHKAIRRKEIIKQLLLEKHPKFMLTR